MIAFELAAAIAGLAAAPQYIEPDRYSATVRPAAQTGSHTASARDKANTKAPAKAGPKANQRQTRKPVANCGTSHKGYDARTGTYRDARGKRQNCPR